MPNSHDIATSQDKFKSTSGLNIAYRIWRPAIPRAIMILVHGFNSHSGYYKWVAEQLAADGFAVYALDLRGRGLSDGERFYVENVADYVTDVDGVVDLATKREPGLPVYLLGHSAGGVVSCVYTLEHQSKLAGLICESFAHQVPAPDFVLAMIKGISRVTPRASILTLKNEDFSRDKAVVDAMNADPLIARESQPAKTVAELVRANERLKKEFPLITLPVMILHGTLDKATKPSGSQYFFDTTGSRDKILKLYEGHFHDLLNDVGREKVMGDIIAWLGARLPVVKAA